MPADRSRRKTSSRPKASTPTNNPVSRAEVIRRRKEWRQKIGKSYACPYPEDCKACKPEGTTTTHCGFKGCHFDGADMNELADHLKEKHCTSELYPKLFICPFPDCEWANNQGYHTMYQWGNMRAHIERTLQNCRILCRYCAQSFSSPTDCTKHEKRAHKDEYVSKKAVKAMQASSAQVEAAGKPNAEDISRRQPEKDTKCAVQNTPNLPTAVSRVIDDNYDDGPVAGPSSGPRFHALASGLSPIARNYNAEPSPPGLASFPTSSDDNWGPLVVPEELDLLLSRPPPAAPQGPLVDPQHAMLNHVAFGISPYEMAYLEANFGHQQYYQPYPNRLLYPMPYDLPIDPVLLHQSSSARIAPLYTSYSTQPQQWIPDNFGVPFPIGVPELDTASADSSQDLDNFILDQNLYDGPGDYDGGLPF